MRVIFLDIDGVLNSSRTAVAFQKEWQRKFDPVAVQMLYRVALNAGAQLVISSTWRLFDDWRSLITGSLVEAGWPLDSAITLYSRTTTDSFNTPYGMERSRGDEIAEWLNKHPDVIDYIILDDDNDMLDSQLSRFIQCDSNVGFGWEQWMQIKAIWPEIYKW